jgi:plasmid stabilization system protein ParE
VKVRLVPRAQADMDRAISWWRENALRPLMLEAALRATFTQFEAGVVAGVSAMSRRVPEARRLLLPTRHVVFFVVDEPKQEVVVLRVWHSSRRRPPGL